MVLTYMVRPLGFHIKYHDMISLFLGLYMEGARWDVNIGSIVESKLKELHPIMPVMYIRAITQDKQVNKRVLK